MKDALSFVVSSKDKLLYDNSYPLYSYQFAKRLGAMNHYLSDFSACLIMKVIEVQRLITVITTDDDCQVRKGLRAFRKFLDEQDTSMGLRFQGVHHNA